MASTYHSLGIEMPQLSPAATALLIFISVICFFAYISIQYTYSYVVATLATIESPAASGDSPPPYTREAAPLLGNTKTDPLVDEEHQGPATPLITSSLRQAKRHLRSVGGRCARFRGFGIYVLLQVLVGVPSTHIGRLVPNPLFLAFVNIVAFTLSTGLYILWVHTVVSVPSSKKWYKRFVGCSQVKRVMVPMAFHALAGHLTWLVPYALGFLLGLGNYGDDGTPRKYEFDIKYAILILCGIFIAVFILFPANVILVRVAASVLPEEELAIVPFDRTFGGRLAPGEILKMRDAWKSFSWEATKRVVKIYIKSFLLQAMVAALWGAAVHTIVRYGKDL